MDLVEGLQYKYKLNQYIDSCLKQQYTYDAIFEYLSNDQGFIDFLLCKIGQIWLKKPIHGQQYRTWQQGGVGYAPRIR